MTSAYVYYRIDPDKASLAAARIDALLGAMAQHCAAPPRRLRRCEDASMWMEVYEGIAEREVFASVLKMAVQTFDCATFIQGDRHLEYFAEAGLEP